MRRNLLQAAGLLEALRVQWRAILALAGTLPVAWALLSPAQNSNYSIRTWQTGQGLPQDSVTSILQTPDGYLWLATFNGLARFDGARFTVFDEGNTPALQSSRLVRLDVDPEGGLWIITEQGHLTQLWQGRFKSWSGREGVPAAGAAAVVRGPKHCVLLVDRAGGVSRLEGDKWVPEPQYNFFRGSRVSLSTDRQERLWAWSSLKRGLAHVEGGQLAWLKHPEGGGEAGVRSLAHSRDGGLWLVLSNRVWHFRCESEEWKPTDWTLPEDVHSLTCMLEDQQGNLWVSSYGNGLVRFGRDGVCERFTTAQGLGHNAVRALWDDREGNLWVGTDGGGLNRLKRKAVMTYGVRHGLSGEVVMALAEDRHEPNALWLGLNGGGINHFRDEKLRGPSIKPGVLTNGFVYGFLEDRQGGFWLGAYDFGILHCEDGRLTQLGKSNEWADKPLLAALEDHAGTIWLGGGFGLLRHREGQLTDLKAELGWSNVRVRALAEDRAPNLYVGTYGQGLYRYNGEGWTRYSEQDGLADNHISCLYVDQEDLLWIGTVNGGLCLWDKERFSNITMREGLPSNSISSIIEDEQGGLWLGSNRGLFRVRKIQLREVAEGRRQLATGCTYGLPEGLSTLECGGGAQPAACRTRDGRLWFATVKGLTVIDPANLAANSAPVPVVIEEVLADGQSLGISIMPGKRPADPRRPARKMKPAPDPLPIPPGNAAAGSSSSTLVIRPGCERVEFRFTGLSFLAPERTQFRYRLEGNDKDWIYGAEQRTAVYTHLPPGRYTFHATACNNDGVWSEAGATLGLVVLPPVWRTWWFRLAAVLTLGGVVFGSYELRLWRVRRQRALQEHFSRQLIASQEDERRRIAGELHDGLGQNLVLIRNRAELGLRQLRPTRDVAEQLKEISAAAAQSLDDVRNTAHALRPYELERLGLGRAIEDAAQKAAETSGVRFACDLDQLDGLFPAEIETVLFRIVQEAFSNVLRHAHASEVIVEVKREPGRLRLTVLDNGRGFEVGGLDAGADGKAGFGLTNIAARAKMAGGQLHIESAPGRGTALTVHLPFRKKHV